VTAARTVVVAGAGIGGLTTALALARAGTRVTLLEQAERLEDVGAGIQLSPNASRVLIDLGLGDRLTPGIVSPGELRVMHARTGYVMARASLRDAAARFGAPYWVIHRGDLQAALRAAIEATALVTLHLGTRAEDFASHRNGITVACKVRGQPIDMHGDAMIAADGLWSALRQRLGHDKAPRFAQHTAWRALVPAQAVGPKFTTPAINLWLGRNGHLVHYPVRGGAVVNVVAIMRDTWHETGWSAQASRDDILTRFAAGMWYAPARDLIAAATDWQKWALYDCAPLDRWGDGPVTLLGDAAHPMLPFLAQGAAMAIEDAAVVAQCLADTDDAAAAFRRYEDKRRKRTARTQRAARRTGRIYHMGGAEAVLRTLALIGMRGAGLLRHYGWLYRWKP
jgi:salicylate hydroxylase